MNNNSPLYNDEIPFEFQQRLLPKEIQTENWKAVEVSINKESTVPSNGRKKFFFLTLSAMLLIGSGLLLYKFSFTGDVHFYKTNYAQVKNITLPDGSKVTLNANSELKLSSDWSEHDDRQVWLDGEAYFEVQKKLATGQKFIVHTKDMDVEVLGTKFNVNTRHQKSTVALEEGKIKLSLNGQTKQIIKKNPKEEIIEMKPGELVTVDSAKGIDLATVPNIDFHSGWVRNEYHFSNTSLKEIATIIKDIHGYTVVVDDENLMQQSITGDLRAANLQELIDVLAIAFKLKITVENKTIRINKPL